MIVVSIGNDINRFLLIKIPNRLSRDFQNSRNLLQNIGIDLFLLFEQGDFLLVPVFAELKREMILFDASISRNRFKLRPSWIFGLEVVCAIRKGVWLKRQFM
jgi:hypothetical protein